MIRIIHRFAAAMAVCAVMLGASSAAYAQRYVRASAAGSNNGSDWNNAWTSLNSASYSSGTVYIAAGTYNTGLPATAASNVTVKRATIAEHGTATGWQDAFDGQVTVSTSAVKFLKVTGGSGFLFDGKGDVQNGWKFRVIGQNAYDGKVQIEGATNATVRGLELDGGGCEPAIASGPEDAFRLGGNTNITIEYNYIHDFWYCSFSGVDNPGHSDAIQMPSATGATIRYNVITNSGMLVFFGDCAWSNQWANNVDIHHNVLIQQAGKGQNYRIMHIKGGGKTATDFVRIHNNTFYRDSGFGGNTLQEDGDCPANTTLRSIKNNIFVNGNITLAGGWGSHSNNNFFGGTTVSESGSVIGNSLFVNQSALDFHLQATSPDIDKGAALGYPVDITGRTITGTPDIGAFEFFSGGSTAAPNPPSNLQVTVN